MQKLALLTTSLWLSIAVSAQQATPQQPTPQPAKPAAAPQNPTPAPAPAAKPEQKPEQGQDPKAADPKADPKAQGKDKEGKTFTPEKLEQLVAPIALYPDGLLSQTMMAATYPLEIVRAARWLEKNPSLKGDALEKALQEQTWDPSVKAMCGLPELLKRLNDNLDWTQDLGDAFLADQSALMDTVQRMRQKAKESGNLETTKEQKVTQRDDKIIVIESADPQVVYVPTYYPTAVYGGWSYPYYYYPPMYPAYPPGYPAFTFAVGVAWGAAIWGGCHWGWGHSECNINVNNFNNFTNRTENNFNRDRVQNRAKQGGAGAGGNRWQHDASHRQGVRYGDKATSNRYQPSTADRAASNQARGRASTQPSAGTRPSTGSNPSAGARPSTGSNPSAGTRPSAGTSNRTTQSAGQKSSSFSGSRSASSDRAASQRGSASRGTTSRSSGGGMRGGGGGRGGGGRR